MRSTPSLLSDIPGGEALLDWFGRVPSFHDAYLLDLGFSRQGRRLPAHPCLEHDE